MNILQILAPHLQIKLIMSQVMSQIILNDIYENSMLTKDANPSEFLNIDSNLKFITTTALSVEYGFH